MSSSPRKDPIFYPNSGLGNPNNKMPDPFPNSRVDPDDALKHALLKLRPRPVSQSGSTSPYSESEPDSDASNSNPNPLSTATDSTALLTDELLLKVFDKIHNRKQHIANSLVCRRWCVLCGKLVKSLKLIDWEFLESGRLSFRFPNLEDVDLVPACMKSARNSGILLSNKLIEVRLSSWVLENDEGLFVKKDDVLESKEIDRGVAILAEGCKNLRRVVLMNVSEEGLNCLAKECELLQEMELHYCGDLALRGIFNCKNLQILKLNGNINAVYDSMVSDIGLTILAQGCRRLVKLELVGCEGSYDGIKAIGQCCLMLEELTICNHRMEGGWLSALSYCGNLKSLSFQSCKTIDENPGLDEHLGSCMMLEELHLNKCQMRNKQGVKALFVVCRSIRELVLEDCWGLDDSIFAAATIFRYSSRFRNPKTLERNPLILRLQLAKEMATGGAPQRGTAAAAAANLRRRKSGGSGGGGVGGAAGGASGTMLQFYTDDAPGLKISPNVVLVMSIGFIAFVALLHVMGKLYFVRKD